MGKEVCEAEEGHQCRECRWLGCVGVTGHALGANDEDATMSATVSATTHITHRNCHAVCSTRAQQVYQVLSTFKLRYLFL